MTRTCRTPARGTLPLPAARRQLLFHAVELGRGNHAAGAPVGRLANLVESRGRIDTVELDDPTCRRMLQLLFPGRVGEINRLDARVIGPLLVGVAAQMVRVAGDHHQVGAGRACPAPGAGRAECPATPRCAPKALKILLAVGQSLGRPTLLRSPVMTRGKRVPQGKPTRRRKSLRARGSRRHRCRSCPRWPTAPSGRGANFSAPKWGSLTWAKAMNSLVMSGVSAEVRPSFFDKQSVARRTSGQARRVPAGCGVGPPVAPRTPAPRPMAVVRHGRRHSIRRARRAGNDTNPVTERKSKAWTTRSGAGFLPNAGRPSDSSTDRR